jgi:hypothetical protein
MAFLDRFSADEREMLVSLPYRAGLWIIAVNGAGYLGRRAKEKTVLEKIIVEKGRGIFESAFVFEVMTEMLRRRDCWEDWAKGWEDVPAVCQNASATIASRLGPHDLSSYQQTIMNIATAMANSFGELDDNVPLWLRAWTYTKLMLSRIVDIETAKEAESPSSLKTEDNEKMVVDCLTGKENEYSDFLNTSNDEFMALTKLAHSLGIDTQTIDDDEDLGKKKERKDFDG